MLARRLTTPAAVAGSLGLALLALAGCTGDDTGPGDPATGSGPTPTVLPPVTPAEGAEARLAQLARLVPQHGSSTYSLDTDLADDGEVVIERRPGGYRVTVTTDETAVLIVREEGGDTFSCTGTESDAQCFTVAYAGDGVPTLFDPQVQYVVTLYPQVFAEHPDEIEVADAAVPDGVDGECFDVRPAGDTLAPVQEGTYCLDEQGRVTYVAYPSGVLRLQETGGVPAEDVLTPPSSPTPLPTESRQPID